MTTGLTQTSACSLRCVSQYFEIIVCAPDGERSWIGHAISRHQKLKAVPKEGFPGQAYALNGTQLTV